MEELLRKHGFDPFVAESVREVGLDQNPAAAEFAKRLAAGEFDAVVFLTGAGVRRLLFLLKDDSEVVPVLRTVATIARGPKPAQALREFGVPPTEVAKDPSTYHEVLEILSRRKERQLAVQEYGRPDPRLLEGLDHLGASVFRVPVYQWALPEDPSNLRRAATMLARGEAGIAVFTSSIQLEHLEIVSAELGIDVLTPLRTIRVASIGPTMSEALKTKGIYPWMEADPPKLGVLVHQLAQKMNQI